MKKLIIASFSTAVLLGAGQAFADRPGEDWIPIEQAIQVAKGAGYTMIKEIEADDGKWEGTGYKNGEEYEFDIDGKTGQIIKEEKDDGLF